MSGAMSLTIRSMAPVRSSRPRIVSSGMTRRTMPVVARRTVEVGGVRRQFDAVVGLHPDEPVGSGADPGGGPGRGAGGHDAHHQVHRKRGEGLLQPEDHGVGIDDVDAGQLRVRPLARRQERRVEKAAKRVGDVFRVQERAVVEPDVPAQVRDEGGGVAGLEPLRHFRHDLQRDRPGEPARRRATGAPAGSLRRCRRGDRGWSAPPRCRRSAPGRAGPRAHDRRRTGRAPAPAGPTGGPGARPVRARPDLTPRPRPSARRAGSAPAVASADRSRSRAAACAAARRAAPGRARAAVAGPGGWRRR